MTPVQSSANPYNKLINAGTATAANAATTSSTGANQVLGQNEFLTLLTTQLKNQDPLNPMDSTQSVSQLAQFSALQATQNLSTSFGAFQSTSAVSQASGLLGKSVTATTTDATGNSAQVTGTVNSIQVVNGAPQFTMTGTSGQTVVDASGTPIEFQTSAIIAITK